MKKYLLILTLIALSALLMAGKDNVPRVFLQRLVLEDGSDPVITVDKYKTAPEYKFEAWIKERPEEVNDSDVLNMHFLAIQRMGNGENIPYTIACKVNLGNFKATWAPGETLCLRVTHKATQQNQEWEVLIPEGGATIRMLDQPQIIPPYPELKLDKNIDGEKTKTQQGKSQSNCNSCHGCD